ncbi:MAG: pyruvate:ferredoxin (flavodoxin) oxidoreductase [Oscillospiraceae bacterium]|nr:pyruvate:ferredoxin (flavodoxin) oxidoreductase [Oscillospiraceae bacterium]
MARKRISMDGNQAAAHASYAFSEFAGIYPITPSSPMADYTDQWAVAGKKNLFGTEVKVVEMQSEAGAAGTVHGALQAGALTTTFTASQGLLLMIPNMYKIAGELLPCVFDVSARTVAAHALNIFGDHSDVYACRQTGFAMLAESNPQEVMDLTAVAHLATIEGRVPVLNFFDGFRTSHEIQKIETWSNEDLADMVNWDAVSEFRKRALNPERPVLRGTAQNGDIFFQAKEAANPYYERFPAIVEKYMDKVNAKIGTDYKLFNYYGAPDAEKVIIAMGSFCDTIEEVIDYMLAAGEKVGLVKVRLYRPFSAKHLVAAIPETVKKIAVLDRTKEPGALGEPLYLDVIAALAVEGKLAGKTVVGGRYGLGSKDTTPACVFAVFANLDLDTPKANFTVGIEDDVTGSSLPLPTEVPATANASTVECKFWGLGGDGTVGANKNSIKIIGDHTDKYVQAYFQYDSKKTGGVTISHLRFGDTPIKSTYYINKADFVACHNPSYIIKGYPMVRDVKAGGTFLINCQWTDEELNEHLPAVAKRYIAKNNIKVYTINAIDLAKEIGMGKRTNTILQSAFFALANILPVDEAVNYMKEKALASYRKKGMDVVELNYKAIDIGKDKLHLVEIPADWATAEDKPAAEDTNKYASEAQRHFNKAIVEPVDAMNGDSLPVSTFVGYEDGTFPLGLSAFEKRGVAVDVPTWDPAKCIQCNQCAYVCSHAAIRPFALTKEEVEKAPAALKHTEKMIGKGCEDLVFVMAVSPLDCMGCGVCVSVCPAKEKAISMVGQESQLDQAEVWNYLVNEVSVKELPFKVDSVKGSQFKQPLLEFSGACAGCVETAYARLITQLFGDRMYIANATGCSSIWGGSAPATPYTTNKDGHGPAWANSLFEDNAEFGLGIYMGQKTIRESLKATLEMLMEKTSKPSKAEAIKGWLDTYNDGDANKAATEALIAELEADPECPVCQKVLKDKEFLAKKSVWIFGGDGWAYDIGFGGLDHVLASGEDINVMVFDTEVYSNTGGQASKSSNVGQVAQFAAAGKGTLTANGTTRVGKKDLPAIAMSYGYVYVAHVGMGADMNQTIKAMKEAEAYNGPSLIIGYAPCEMHSIKGGMTNSQAEIKRAVDTGYWNLFRFNPALKAEGKNPFTLDSKAPKGGYQEFLMNEARYSRLMASNSERAKVLFAENEKQANDRYEHLLKLVDLYK